ncbi:MAG: hypothetical protein ACK53L_14000, partial [Pirellulaceae bacterium]
GGRAGEEERTVGGDVRGVLDRVKSGGLTGLTGLGSSGLAVELAGDGAGSGAGGMRGRWGRQLRIWPDRAT